MTTPQTPTILVVDDQPSNVTLMIDFLKIQGYTLLSAYDGQSALDKARQQPVDLILLDVNMPIMNGYEVCKALKADDVLESIPVIFVSAVDDPQVKVMGFKVGGVDYVQKPFQREELLARIVTHLELRRKQREIEALQQQEIDYLKQVSQLKDQMVRMVSHDIKNPLSIMMSAAERLQSYGTDYFTANPRAADYLGLIVQGSEKIEALVREILDKARAEEWSVLNSEQVSLTPYLRHCIEEQLFLAQTKQLQVHLTPPIQDVEVRLSPRYFSQVLQNLLTNAIKYTPEGGTIEVSIDIHPADIHIKVRDTGIGIPAEDLPHLFDKFYRVRRAEHRKQSGSGFGLTIVKAIVEQHGGRVWVESELGKGSTFTVSLPR